MEILDVIIDNHGPFIKYKHKWPCIRTYFGERYTSDKVAQVLRLLATHVDNLETQKEIINEFTKPNLKF